VDGLRNKKVQGGPPSKYGPALGTRLGLPDKKFQKEDILAKKGGHFYQKEDAENNQHKNHQ
jgi:hypothetical protein